VTAIQPPPPARTAYDAADHIVEAGAAQRAAGERGIKPANLLRAADWQFEYRQKTAPHASNLEELTYGTYRIASGGASDELYHRVQEALLFSLGGEQEVEVDGVVYSLAHYDTLYIPRGTPYRVRATSADEGLIAVFRAPAAARHAVFHARWAHMSQDESRIRHLDGKDVFLMFDVSEPADRLVAGYTIYRAETRAWPPHNHTDQEEIYLFTKGRGAMEVYEEEKTKTFVHSMNTMDAATIPVRNFHPVFSQDEELHFIWCLCGARYWVGDKNKAFMDASVDTLTT